MVNHFSEYLWTLGTTWEIMGVKRFKHTICGVFEGEDQLEGGLPVDKCVQRRASPSLHQPSKAELEEDVSIDATPESLAWAVTRGGAERREPSKPQTTSDSS